MITAFFITVLPTLLAYILLRQTALKPKSMYLKIALAWFTGLFFFTTATYFFSVYFSFITSTVLSKAVYLSLLLTTVLLLFFVKRLHALFVILRKELSVNIFSHQAHLLILITCLTFSYAFFAPHLATTQEKIYTSPIYWDFHWHAAVIQNFVHGDNFPPQNEALAGEPMTYHFFGDLVMAIYSAAGLQLTDAITVTSILFFCMLLLTLIGLGEELFRTKWIGALAGLLLITSSSGHFFYYFSERLTQPLWQTMLGIFTEKTHPWQLSHIANSPFGYNGTMFNLFYYVEERHLIVGLVYLLLSFWIIHIRKHLSSMMLVILGICMAAFFFWHLYITAIVGIGMITILVFGDQRKKTVYLLCGFLFIFAAQYLYIKYLIGTSAAFVQTAANYPQLNFEFAVRHPERSPIAVSAEIIFHYVFAYGIKIFFIPLAFIMLWQKNKQLTLLLLSVIIPTFIMVNTLQISPTAIHENHKLLLPMNVLVNLAVAFCVYYLFFHSKRVLNILAGIICLILLTLSGVIEHMPFLNSQPSVLYADYSATSLTATIQKHSEPHAVIIGKDGKEIQLAGRKLFVGDSAGPAPAIDTKAREAIITKLYQTSDVASFCKQARENNIDFVEFSKIGLNNRSSAFINFPQFRAKDSKGNEVIFINTEQGCINP